MNGREHVPWKELHAYLSSGRLQEDQVTELVEVAAQFGEQGWPSKVFPKGIPFPDGVVVHTVFGRDRFEEFMRLIVDQSRLDVVRVFPKGIPVPDWFAAELELR